MYKIWFERASPPFHVPLLQGIANVIGPASSTPDQPFVAIPEAHGIVASIMHYDAHVMDLAPRLLVISRTGIGYDKVDIAAASEHGIAVCNAPDGPTISTAEHSVMLMFAVAKKMKWAEHELRHSRKSDFFKDHFGIELYQKRLGLVGLGRIASHVATIAQAVGMSVRAFDPYVDPQRVAATGVELMPSLQDMLAMADVVSLHVPLDADTRCMINAERLAQMKRGAILINTARGGLVDEAALLDALERGHLFGAGLDVTDPSPAQPDNPLLHRQDVVITPHVAAATEDGKNRIYNTAIKQVLQVLRGERPPHLVNPDVWPRVLDRIGSS